MNGFVVFARPWWVNLLILVPAVGLMAFRKGLALSKTRLAVAALFGAAFGFVEAAVVVYLRAATGLLPTASSDISRQILMLTSAARQLLTLEFFRNAATIVMIVAIAWLAAPKLKQRCATFLWVFAFWDLSYYLWLWLAIRWPNSLTSPDVLFLIPAPWVSQVWFPCLISGAVILIIAWHSGNKRIG